jgi:hypothetical protein
MLTKIFASFSIGVAATANGGKSVHPIYRQIIGGKKEEVVKLS